MTGRLLIRITPVTGEISDLRYQHLWSAWLDGELLGHPVAARGLTEEAVVRLGKVKVRPWA